MARICEIVHHKLQWLFGESGVRNDYELVKEKIYSPLGINPKEGVSNSDIKHIAESISGLLPNSRIIALEHEDEDGELWTKAWEQYGDNYSHDWVSQALIGEPERRYHIFFTIDQKM
jgi:hypothetical protein